MNQTHEVQQVIGRVSAPPYFTTLFEAAYLAPLPKAGKKIGIFGDPFYSIYARALGLDPVLISGGSYYTGEVASHIFPQISDPVAKAAVGLLLDPEKGLCQGLDAVLVSANNDSYKKATYYIRQAGVEVIEVEPMPFVLKKMPVSYIVNQVQALIAMSKIAHTHLDWRTLKRDLGLYRRGHQLMESLSFLSLPTLTQDFLAQTFHLARKKEKWCDELEQFLLTVPAKTLLPHVQVVGSAMELPNIKIHDILSEIGVEQFENHCLTLPTFHEIPLKKGALSQLWACLQTHYRQSATSRSMSHDKQYGMDASAMGIIYYLLKGQTSEAYHAERLEEWAISQGVPYLCVETDYTNTDKEQLKIRMEAFYEMLSAKHAKSSLAAS